MYDYYLNVKEDVKNVILEEFTHEQILENLRESERPSFETDLFDLLFDNDRVTGNGSGSYTFCRRRAEENLVGNFDLLVDAIEDFGYDGDNLFELLKSGAEYLDVTIRCYLLGGSISEVLDELGEELKNEKV